MKTLPRICLLATLLGCGSAPSSPVKMAAPEAPAIRKEDPPAAAQKAEPALEPVARRVLHTSRPPQWDSIDGKQTFLTLIEIDGAALPCYRNRDFMAKLSWEVREQIARDVYAFHGKPVLVYAYHEPNPAAPRGAWGGVYYERIAEFTADGVKYDGFPDMFKAPKDRERLPKP